MMTEPVHFLVASDFDQTLSFNDSGVVLSQLIGASGFEEKVAGLASSNLVHQGGELAYLLRHDPEFRGVRREHLVEAGRRVRLKQDIPQLVDVLEKGIPGCRFSFFVISAAPREVICVTLEGVVAQDGVHWIAQTLYLVEPDTPRGGGRDSLPKNSAPSNALCARQRRERFSMDAAPPVA